jgi:hypothetical protein
MKKILAVYCFALMAAVNVYANSWGTDRSDVWWTPSESGWGAFITQQQDTIFMGLFVYDENNRPTYFVSTLKYDLSIRTYSGDLYATQGPPIFGPFNPDLVTRTMVGTAALQVVDEIRSNRAVIDTNRFNLTYTVNGQTIRKVIERMTWARNQLSGNYFGGLVGYTSSCNSSSDNGYLTLIANLTLVQSENQLRFYGTFQNNRGLTTFCTFTSTYEETGRITDAVGTYSCNSGEYGVFELSGLEATSNGVLASALGNSNVCAFQGRFGAIRQ